MPGPKVELHSSLMVPRRLIVTALCAMTLVACGERIRFKDIIRVPVTVPGFLVAESLWDTFTLEEQAALGGTLPELWPEDEPRLVADVEVPMPVPIARDQLGRVGEDLQGIEVGDLEPRLRDIELLWDPKDLNHPVVAGALWALPNDQALPGDEGTRRIGYLTGFDGGTGHLVFDPGGRHALAEHLPQDRSVLLVALTVAVDTGRDPAMPTGSGDLELVVHLDVLR